MKPIRRSLVVSLMTVSALAPMAAQVDAPPAPPRPVRAPRAMQAPRAIDIDGPRLIDMRGVTPRVLEIPPPAPGMEDAPRAFRLRGGELEPMDIATLPAIAPNAFAYSLATPRVAPLPPMDFAFATPRIAPLPPMDFAFAPPQSAAERERERAREAQERAREQAERIREQAERAREMVDRNADMYLTGKRAIDNGEYERAVKYFERVIESKGNNVEGALYFKAYSLHKLGKREEALTTIAEFRKQYAQSKWRNDIDALEVEIKQLDPNSVGTEDLQLMALVGLMNADPERGIPMIEKLINDPKKPVQLKRRALFVLANAQARSDKARDLMGRYAKSAANPDIQFAAVTYLGQSHTRETRQILADVYAGTNDVNVKGKVLKSLGEARDTERLAALAKSETNLELRREAIRGLGNAQGVAELAQLYSSESNSELKEGILRSLANSNGSERLMEIAKSEKDAKLRATAIQYLGRVRREKSADALASLYAAESDKNIKYDIMRAMANQSSAKQLVDIARAEKDADLKVQAVKYLSNMRSKEAQDYMMEILSK